MAQTISSKSFTVNQAAKDDVICLNPDGTFTLASILANDPGSAVFQSTLFNPNQGVTYNGDGTFTVTDFDAVLANGFNYIVRMANGTYSTAHVTVDGTMITSELLVNGSFEQDQTTVDGAYMSFASLPGWTTNQGSAGLEVVADGYFGISESGTGHWLDTRGSPGAIDISQSVELATGKEALLTVKVAAENIGGRLTDPNSTLEFTFNGQVVLSITAAQLGDSNTFHEIQVTVHGADSTDTLRIHDTGNVSEDYVGFAIGSVSLTTEDYIC